MGPHLGPPLKLKPKFKFSRPTLTERMYAAHVVIFFNPKDGVQIHKNRYGSAKGKVSTSALISILVKLLVHNIFEKRMKLFKVGMEMRLKKAIKKIVKEGA